MTTTLGARAARYFRDAFRGIDQAPVEVIATLCIALTFSLALELGDPTFQSWAEVAVACGLLLAVAWTGTLLHAMGVWDATRRWALTVGGALVIAIYALTVQDFQYAAEGWRAALLIAAAVSWLLALPAFGGPADARVERMRRIDGRILLRMIGAVLYGAALFAGLALALRAIDVLFELGLRDEIYGHVWGWIAFVLIPWIVLGGLPDYVRPIEQTTAVASVAHRIVLYLVPPLLALYYVILYAYVVRIVVTGEIPKNLVSPLVLTAGGLAALALMLFDPRPAGSGLARWLRRAPPLFLPLAPLGAWALVVRIDQYGWTEFRVVRIVVLGALAVLAVAATVQLVRHRPFALWLAPLALAVVLLLGAIGPWSALALSRRSQQGRLRTALERVDVPLQDTTFAAAAADSATPPREVPAATYEQIRSSAQYLTSHFGAQTLPRVLRRLALREDGRWLDYAAELGLQSDSLPRDARMAMGGSLPYNVPVELAGGTAYRIQWMPGMSGRVGAPPPRSADDAGHAYVVLQDSMRLALHIGEQMLYADLGIAMRALETRVGRTPDDLPLEYPVLPVTDAAGVERGELMLWHLWANADSAVLRIGRMEGLVVVRRE